MKKQILLNGITNDIAPTLLAGYYKYGVATLITGNFGTSGGAILEIETMQELINTDSNGNAKAIRACYGQCGFDSVLRGGGQGITGVMEEIEPKIVGYSRDSEIGKVKSRHLKDLANTITTCTGSGNNCDQYVAEPKMMQLVGDRGNPSVSVKETAFTVCSTPMSDRGQMVMEPKIAASRGRGESNRQQLEINDSGTSNTITTSLKDNFLLEPRKEGIKIGEKYGRLTVLEKTSKKQGTNYLYKCKCDCGNIKLVSSGRLGISTFSCGCYKIECHRTHNESRTRLYNIWIGMKSRCCNPDNQRYHSYGGRGIGICDEWRDSFEKFRDWAYLNGYSEHYTIDRIDNNGDYEPQNCRWATDTAQVRNRNPYGEIPYDGIVRDSTGYRAQITINGKKIYIAHSVGDIEYLVNKRNEYIIEHNLDFKIQKYIKENPMKNEKSNIKDSSKSLSSNTELRMEEGCMVDKEGRKYRIRKLTPTECFRLMDVEDEDIEKMKQAGIAKTNLYKLAGNSIVVSCMFHLFRKLFIEKDNENQQLELF